MDKSRWRHRVLKRHGWWGAWNNNELPFVWLLVAARAGDYSHMAAVNSVWGQMKTCFSWRVTYITTHALLCVAGRPRRRDVYTYWWQLKTPLDIGFWKLGLFFRNSWAWRWQKKEKGPSSLSRNCSADECNTRSVDAVTHNPQWCCLTWRMECKTGCT